MTLSINSFQAMELKFEIGPSTYLNFLGSKKNKANLRFTVRPLWVFEISNFKWDVHFTNFKMRIGQAFTHWDNFTQTKYNQNPEIIRKWSVNTVNYAFAPKSSPILVHLNPTHHYETLDVLNTGIIVFCYYYI